ncbi:amphi-Trp domain-containing protein [Natribaculum luteum]|uniref:Amphi-Trp domain-containing protein n=1 Tax=Natribaculum luteum TaxID=1586232 RepID=A0ABD5NUL5_9EURY|nr:amphi-Trp domain-containing protein [Natribaculum luteum]
MSEEDEFEYERDLTRDQIADHLEDFAKSLRGTDELEFEVGPETVVVNPPETVEFELEIEDEPDEGGVERSIEFELEWMRTEDEEPLQIQSTTEE